VEWLWVLPACMAGGTVFFAALLWTGGITPADLWRAARGRRGEQPAGEQPAPDQPSGRLQSSR
jgi:hypothetical protein